MKQVYEIDDNGFYAKPAIIKDDDLIPDSCVIYKWDKPLYKPKWNGSEWFEGATPEEIAELNVLNNQPQEPTTEERITALEDALLMIL